MSARRDQQIGREMEHYGLQSPNSVIVHTGGTQRLSIDNGGTVQIQGVFVVQGAVDDGAAWSVLDTMPPYSVIMAVEPTSQGTALCWYWKDGNRTRRKAWDGGMTI